MTEAPHQVAGSRRHAPNGGYYLAARRTVAPSARSGAARQAARAQQVAGLAFLAGLWLVVSPYVLGFDHAPLVTYDDMAVGGAIAVLGLLGLTVTGTPHRQWWLVFALGLWAVVSPLLLRYPPDGGRGPAAWNGIASGALAVALAAWGVVLAERGPARSARA